MSNESAEILRMLDGAFDAFATRPLAPLYPEAHRAAIDAINERVYATVNNGVYRAGFATAQAPYDEAVAALFDTLDALEKHLDSHTHLVGDVLTEADVRLFTTLARFDAVYVGHFRSQPAAARRLPEPLGIRAAHLPAAARGRDRALRPHQGALLPEPRGDQPDPHRAARPHRGLVGRLRAGRGPASVPGSRYVEGEGAGDGSSPRRPDSGVARSTPGVYGSSRSLDENVHSPGIRAPKECSRVMARPSLSSEDSTGRIDLMTWNFAAKIASTSSLFIAVALLPRAASAQEQPAAAPTQPPPVVFTSPPAAAPAAAPVPQGSADNPVIVQLHPQTGALPTTVALSGPAVIQTTRRARPSRRGTTPRRVSAAGSSSAAPSPSVSST